MSGAEARAPAPAPRTTLSGWRLSLPLARACHPLPALAVTIVIVGLARHAGRDTSGLVVVGLAALAGQLSVGWSNDAHDVDRDRRAGRVEKPTVRGEITARALWVCAALALLATACLSLLAAGPFGGGAHILAVMSAWTYNLWLKATVLSALPYLVSFALVPAFVSYGLDPPASPATWVVVTCALLGVGAHLANSVPDIASDQAVGAGGLAARLGPTRATLASLVCVLAALAVLLRQLELPTALFVGLLLVAVTGVVLSARQPGRVLFRYTLGLAAVAITLLLASAAPIS